MNYTVTEETLDTLDSHCSGSEYGLNWPSVFVLPAWLKVWWQIFVPEAEMFIRSVRDEDRIVGIAPLMLSKDTASFIGNTDVCDYLDFITAPGTESEFFKALLDYLRSNGVKNLDLGHVRADSTILTYLCPLCESTNYQVISTKEDVSLEMNLPDSWENYLGLLNSKQRHEVRRKLRRLLEEGEVEYSVINDAEAVPATMDTFFRMFITSRQDKADFMTEKMEGFFRLLVDTMQDIGLLKLGVLKLDSRAVAEILCFDYNNCMYLYNSGYDPEYTSLSAGLLSKVLAIKDSIEKGRSKFDFLKGAEAYKYHLGGQEVSLYRCQITIK